jgi:hypothetical protein
VPWKKVANDTVALLSAEARHTRTIGATRSSWVSCRPEATKALWSRPDELACCAVDGDVGAEHGAKRGEVDDRGADPESELDQLIPIAGVACMRGMFLLTGIPAGLLSL